MTPVCAAGRERNYLRPSQVWAMDGKPKIPDIVGRC